MTPKPATPIPDQAMDHHDVGDLCLGAQLVLCAARSWAACGDGDAGGDLARFPSPPSPCAVFRCGGVTQEAYGAFAAVLAVLGAAGRPTREFGRPEFRRPEFRGLHDRTLSGDEEGLIEAIAALQHGTPWRAQRILSGWLAAPAVPRAVALLAVTAEGLRAAGLVLGAVEVRPTLH
jgi:hypothetical protein